MYLSQRVLNSIFIHQINAKKQGKTAGIVKSLDFHIILQKNLKSDPPKMGQDKPLKYYQVLAGLAQLIGALSYN